MKSKRAKMANGPAQYPSVLKVLMKIMRYVDKFTFFLMIIVHDSEGSSATGCGMPGRSRKSLPINAGDREIFDEGFRVEYRCQNLPLGDTYRTCEDSKWSGSIPKCPELLNATGLSVRASSPKSVHFSWQNEMKVVGVQIAVRRPGNVTIWPEIDVEGVNGLGDTLKMNVRTGSGDDIRLVRIANTSPDARYLEELTEITVRTKSYVAECTVNADGQWLQLDTNIEVPYLCIVQDWYGLYHIDETVDDCQTPDIPLHAIMESTFRSKNTQSPVFSCMEGYRLKPSQHSPTCAENGDWTLYDFQPCEEVFCDKEETDLKLVSLDRSATSGSRFPIGTKAFLSCSTPEDKRYVICAENGAWLPKTELCDTSFFRTENLVIGLAVCLVLVVICMPIAFFWLYRRVQHVSPVTEIPMEQFDTSTRNVPRYAAVNYTEHVDSLQNESANYEYIDYAAKQTNVAA
ncbi:hypothetical protein HDE_14085 [Halotydeus destructor]|nr:hypothetical protein HDE_14085 [Halotydeus destructor]